MQPRRRGRGGVLASPLHAVAMPPSEDLQLPRRPVIMCSFQCQLQGEEPSRHHTVARRLCISGWDSRSPPTRQHDPRAGPRASILEGQGDPCPTAPLSCHDDLYANAWQVVRARMSLSQWIQGGTRRALPGHDRAVKRIQLGKDLRCYSSDEFVLKEWDVQTGTMKNSFARYTLTRHNGDLSTHLIDASNSYHGVTASPVARLSASIGLSWQSADQMLCDCLTWRPRTTCSRWKLQYQP